jgi:flagellar biosynthesis/type III secretory pathway M-ring protein FliF/YscJ
MGAIVVIAAFFVITSISFSNRFEEDYAAETWKNRWLLLDGWLGLLYLACFCAIAYIWRPSENNRRLAMSDELATDEADADEYEIDTLRDNRLEDEERADGKNGPPSSSGAYNGVGNDGVVFDIGEEGEDDSEDEGDVGKTAGAAGQSSSSHQQSHQNRSKRSSDGTAEEFERLRTSIDLEDDSDKRSLPPSYDSGFKRKD